MRKFVANFSDGIQLLPCSFAVQAHEKTQGDLGAKRSKRPDCSEISLSAARLVADIASAPVPLAEGAGASLVATRSQAFSMLLGCTMANVMLAIMVGGTVLCGLAILVGLAVELVHYANDR